MFTYVVRVWLPDRPGALGQVASRIGAVHGDVIGIDILERGGGSAIDELTVSLPQDELVDLLISEIRQVDGVAVEDVRRIEGSRPDAATAALSAIARLAETAPDRRAAVFCDELRTLVDGAWAVLLGSDSADVVASSGPLPDLGWLTAFVAGSRHLPAAGDGSPGDIVWAQLPRRRLTVVSSRSGRPFHARERIEVDLLARVIDAL